MVCEDYPLGCKHQACIIPCVLTMTQSLQRSKNKYINSITVSKAITVLHWDWIYFFFLVALWSKTFNTNTLVNRFCFLQMYQKSKLQDRLSHNSLTWCMICTTVQSISFSRELFLRTQRTNARRYGIIEICGLWFGMQC